MHSSIGVTLAGTGAPGRLVIARRLAFPKIVAGTSLVKQLSITNSGLGVLHGNIGTIIGLSEPFSVIAGGSFTLSHNQSTLVEIEFSPGEAGVYSGRPLAVTSDDPAHSAISVIVSGSAK